MVFCYLTCFPFWMFFDFTASDSWRCFGKSLKYVCSRLSEITTVKGNQLWDAVGPNEQLLQPNTINVD